MPHKHFSKSKVVTKNIPSSKLTQKTDITGGKTPVPFLHKLIKTEIAGSGLKEALIKSSGISNS